MANLQITSSDAGPKGCYAVPLPGAAEEAELANSKITPTPINTYVPEAIRRRGIAAALALLLPLCFHTAKVDVPVARQSHATKLKSARSSSSGADHKV